MHVLIIGAGVIGAAVADALAHRGASVTVLDMRAPGRGASQASAGILAPFIEAEPSSPLLQLGRRSLALYDDWILRLRETTGLAIDYARTGTIEVAMDDEQVRHLQASVDWVRSVGLPAQWLDGGDARALERAIAPDALGAALIATHGYVGVASLVAALTESAKAAGAVFVAPVEAAQIEPQRDRVDVRVGDDRHAADAVVIAAGSWSRRVRVAGVAAFPVRPVRGQLLHVAWQSPDLPTRVIWGPNCYAVPWPDGSLLVGATMEEAGFDERPTVEGVHALTSAVRALLPGTATASLEAVRVGLRPATPDGLPAIGPLDRAPRVIMATGHFRNGILLAPLTAAMVESALLDGRPDDMSEVVRPDRLL